MADWLRPVFARTKTPVTSFADRQSSFSDDKSDDGDISRPRPTSRVSSYMNTNIRSSTPPLSQTPDSFTNIRSPESVYHKPSVDHMAETLKVVMMTQSSMDPVPITYNGCILHVLEVSRCWGETIPSSGLIMIFSPDNVPVSPRTMYMK
jgi:hypothetical protein